MRMLAQDGAWIAAELCEDGAPSALSPRARQCTGPVSTGSKGPRPTDGTPWATESVEMRTLNLTPVGPGSDATEEDKLFWSSSPTGSLQLGVVNQAAWEHFELGKKYYLDFSPAE